MEEVEKMRRKKKKLSRKAQKRQRQERVKRVRKRTDWDTGGEVTSTDRKLVQDLTSLVLKAQPGAGQQGFQGVVQRVVAQQRRAIGGWDVGVASLMTPPPFPGTPR